MTIYKPADLIVTVSIYEAVDHLQKLQPAAQGALTADQMAEAVARHMLGSIAGMASPATVFKMLAVIEGAPTSIEEMHKRMAAVNEAQATA